MTLKTVHAVVAVLGMALASGAAWWFQNPHRSEPSELGRAKAQALVGSAPGPRAAGVEVAQVERATLRDDAQAVGTLRSRQSVMLRPEVAGRVRALGFGDGARVRKGQWLVQLDDTLQRAELQQAQAQLSIARANHQRNQELVAQNFVARRVLDESAANLQVAQAQLSLAQARLDRMVIAAPFDGTVGLRNVNVGDYVKDGADLVNLEDIAALYVDFRLPERYQTRLGRGQRVEVQLDALPGRAYTARVQAIDPLIDASGRSVAVRAVMPNDAGEPLRAHGRAPVRGAGAPARGEGPLRPGMFARVTAVFAVRENTLSVPEEALVPQGGRQYVIKVVGPASLPEDARAGLAPEVTAVSQRVEVTLGVRRPGRVEILSGLESGETVVVAGQQRLLKDAMPVRVVVPAAPAAGASAPTRP